MRELIAYFVIVCLAIASGASIDERSVMYWKDFKHDDNKDVIYSLYPFSKDELVYAVCEGSSADKKCKVYMESANLNVSTVKSCDLNLKYGRRFDYDGLLVNAGNSRAIFALRDGATKLKLISVKMNGCDVKEASVDVKFTKTTDVLDEPVKVVPHEENYDVFYQNEDLCQEFIYKATVDYDGKVVKAGAPFRVRDLDFNVLNIAEAANKTYLVSESYTIGPGIRVFLMQDGEYKPNRIELFADLDNSSFFSNVGLSTTENKLGYCVELNYQTQICQQYDAEGKIKKFEFEVDEGEQRNEYISVHNLEKGLLTVSVGRRPLYGLQVLLRHYDEQGKLGRTHNINLKCLQRVVFSNLYKNSNGQYCLSLICFAPLDHKQNNFSRGSRCFFNSELF